MWTGSGLARGRRRLCMSRRGLRACGGRWSIGECCTEGPLRMLRGKKGRRAFVVAGPFEHVVPFQDAAGARMGCDVCRGLLEEVIRAERVRMSLVSSSALCTTVGDKGRRNRRRSMQMTRMPDLRAADFTGQIKLGRKQLVGAVGAVRFPSGVNWQQQHLQDGLVLLLQPAHCLLWDEPVLIRHCRPIRAQPRHQKKPAV